MNRIDSLTPLRPGGLGVVPVLGDLLALVRLVRDPAQGTALKVLVALALAYVVSPVDAFPEAVMPFIAWVDDVGLVLLLRAALGRRLDPYRYPVFGAQPASALEPSEG